MIHMQSKDIAKVVAGGLLITAGAIGTVVYVGQNPNKQLSSGTHKQISKKTTTTSSEKKGLIPEISVDKKMREDYSKDTSASKSVSESKAKQASIDESNKELESADKGTVKNIGILPKAARTTAAADDTLPNTGTEKTSENKSSTIRIQYVPTIYKKIGEGLTASEITNSIINADTKESLAKYVTLKGSYIKEVAGTYDMNFIVSMTGIQDFKGSIKVIYGNASSAAVAPQSAVAAQSQQTKAKTISNTASVSAAAFRQAGRINQNGISYTYYNLPMAGIQTIAASKGHTLAVDGDGVWRDEEGYVVVAYGMGEKRFTTIDTPLGMGRVYDSCPAGAADIAVTW
ncbi:hypothetical protein [Pseudolactococcus insecticola]|uniref:G5 domain-containing protein n=1 Tax=Pseudolactococcus insecticola TaxID=2709158 RepID=A0A6A0B9Y2_9LACT|nr:hypothetical protein [Lactococcus insecticola]GFH41258.1 hypothetical protein Hs20B_16560 [Lactococcus insecticola]